MRAESKTDLHSLINYLLETQSGAYLRLYYVADSKVIIIRTKVLKAASIVQDFRAALLGASPAA